MKNIYQDNEEYFQKIIHVSAHKLIEKYGEWDETMREYTALVHYDKHTKVARFEVSITHPKLDRFSREQGRLEVMKKLDNEMPAMLVNFSKVAEGVDPAYEKKMVARMLTFFTHEIVPLKLQGKHSK